MADVTPVTHSATARVVPGESPACRSGSCLGRGTVVDSLQRPAYGKTKAAPSPLTRWDRFRENRDGNVAGHRGAAREVWNVGESPSQDAAERAVESTRGHWYDAANELDITRHRLLIASLNGETKAERIECREAMYQATVYYWTALEAYAQAQQHLADLNALAAAALHKEAI